MPQAPNDGFHPHDEASGGGAGGARLALLLPLALVVLAYADAPLGSFVWDDHALIGEQELVRELASPWVYFERMFWSDPLRVSQGFYRPLVTLSYALEYRLWGGTPAGFHATNVLLHLSVTALVYLLCRRAGAGRGASAVASSLFGVLPRLTESVAWISGRTDVLAALFAFSALLAWPRAEHSGWGRRGLSAALLLLGLLCKEVAAAALIGIGVFELLEFCRGRRTGRSRTLRHLSVLLVPLAVYAALRRFAEGADVRAMQGIEQVGLPLGARWEAALASLAHYARMLVDAWRPETQIGRLGEHPPGQVLLGGLVLLGGAWLLIRAGRRGRAEQVAALWTGVAALGMVLHLVPLALHVLAADRFLYVPVAMFAVAFAAPIEGRLARWPHRRGVLLAAGLLLVSFVLASRERVLTWNDEHRLWTRAAAEAGPTQFYAFQQLADLQMDAKLWDLALEHLKQSERAYGPPGSLTIWNNIAVCLDHLGRRQESIALFEQMARGQQQDQRVRFNLVMAYLRSGRFQDAQGELTRLEQNLPGDATLAELRQLVARSQQSWARLGSPVDEESLAKRVERARYHQEVGASMEAVAAWNRVLDARDVDPGLRRQAAGFLVFEAPLDLSTKALEHLRQQGVDPEEVALMEEAVAARRHLQ